MRENADFFGVFPRCFVPLPDFDWHGPSGDHDQWRELDYDDPAGGHDIYGFPAFACWAQAWINSFVIIQLFTGLVVLLLPLRNFVTAKRSTSRSIFNGMPAKLLLAIALQGVTWTAEAAPRCPAIHRSEVPKPTDLEVWAAGQLTLREQLANAIASYAYTVGLQHNCGEARQPSYAIPAERQLAPDPLAEDLANVHVTMWLAMPYYETEILDVEVRFPTTTARLLEIAKDACSVMPDYQLRYEPVVPQVGDTFASILVTPAWVDDKIPVAIDCRHIGGTVFAAYLEGSLTCAKVLQYVAECDATELDVFAPGQQTPSAAWPQRCRAPVLPYQDLAAGHCVWLV